MLSLSSLGVRRLLLVESGKIFFSIVDFFFLLDFNLFWLIFSDSYLCMHAFVFLVSSR